MEGLKFARDFFRREAIESIETFLASEYGLKHMKGYTFITDSLTDDGYNAVFFTFAGEVWEYTLNANDDGIEITRYTPPQRRKEV